MTKKILFLESDFEYANLINLDNINYEFDGYKYYKKKYSYFEKYSLIISKSYHSEICNLIIHKANYMGVPTAFLVDGIVEWTNCISHPIVLKKKEKLFSNIRHKFLLCPGHNVSKIIAGNKGISFMNENVLRDSYTNNINQEKLYDILITVANTPSFNKDELYVLINLIRAVIDEAIKMKLSICLRIKNKEILEKINEYSLDNRVDIDFSDFLGLGKVLFTSPSTVGLSALLSNIPVCQFQYRVQPILFQTGWNLPNEIFAEQVLNSMLDRNSENMKFQKMQCENFQDALYSKDLNSINKYQVGVFESELKDIDKILSSDLLGMLESPYNLNIEYFLRKVKRFLNF